MTASAATARLEARISPDLHSMLKHAAELEGRSMADFVVAAAQEAAKRTIEQSGTVRLARADQECLARLVPAGSGSMAPSHW